MSLVARGHFAPADAGVGWRTESGTTHFVVPAMLSIACARAPMRFGIFLQP